SARNDRNRNKSKRPAPDRMLALMHGHSPKLCWPDGKYRVARKIETGLVIGAQIIGARRRPGVDAAFMLMRRLCAPDASVLTHGPSAESLLIGSAEENPSPPCGPGASADRRKYRWRLCRTGQRSNRSAYRAVRRGETQ